MARQVGTAGKLDDAGQSRLGRVDPLGVGIETAPPSLPELACGQGVARRVRLHASLAGEVAGERIEPRITAPLDRREARPLSDDPADPIRAEWIAQDFQSQVVRPRERGDRL
ncbi:MAG: hypothetical protein WKF75_20400, partial [Singulisphaera sp.]